MDTKVILVRCLEIGMACKLHHVVFPHALFEPVADCNSPQIVERTGFDTCPSYNLAKIWAEIVDHLQSRIRIRPLAFGAKLVLDVIVPGRRHEDIRMPVGLPALVISKELRKFIGQRERSAVSIFDQPFPGLGGVRFRRDFYSLLFEIDVSPSAIQKFSSPQSGREGNDNQQVPPQTSLIIGILASQLCSDSS